MGAFYDEIPGNLIDWIERQKIFFVATAPLQDGRVNVSPKELEGLFQVVSRKKVWYQDLTGSGIETIAHIKEEGNGRMTIMFVAFDGPPRIVRLFGKGRAHERTTEGFKKYLPDGDARIRPGARAVVELDIEKVGTSCGYSIPYFDYVKPRPTLDDHNRKKQDLDLLYPGAQLDDSDLLERPVNKGGLRDYWATKNAQSVHNGLEGLDVLVQKGRAEEAIEKDSATAVKTPKSKRTVDKAPPLPDWAKTAVRGKPTRSTSDDIKLLISCTLLGVFVGMSLGDYWTKFVWWAADKGAY